MAFTFRSSIAALNLALVLGLALTGSAAQARPEIDPARLEAFVTAAIAAERVREAWTPRIDRAGSGAEAARLMEQADAAMIAAIEEIEGMTPDDYRMIYRAAQEDPELAAWLIALHQERASQ